MKSLFLNTTVFTVATILLSFQAQATERAYRLNENSMSGRYAIGWGVHGQKTDFEAIEQQGADAVSAYINANFDKFENYLVDTQTDSVILTLTDPQDGESTGRLGSYYFGNHFSFNIDEVAIANDYDYDVSALIAQTGHRWDSSITAIYIMKGADGSGKAPEVTFTNKDAQAQLDAQIVKYLTGSRLKLWNDGAHDISVENNNFDRQDVNFEIYSSVPKQDGPSLTVKGMFQIDAKNNYAVVLKKMTAKIEK